jgi:DNA-binding PadR family transcriptional regulator
LASSLDALILDLLEWIGTEQKPYSEVMDAWRTSCPRLTVWEDANDRGFVERRFDEGRGAFVSLTALGRDFLARHRRAVTSTRERSRQT